MPIPNIPPVLPMPIANSGDVNDIPVTTPTGTGQLSFQAGFPFITQVPLLAGGIAPSRPDFNAVMKLLSQHTFFAQSGGVYPWMGANGDFAGLNYLTGWHVLGSNGHEYIAKLPSGPDLPDSGGGFVGPKDPTTDDGTYWVDMMDDNDLSNYGTYTTRAIVTSSSTYTAPVSGWYRVTCIGGGGGGGHGADNDYGGKGGAAGGATSFNGITAPGGSGGGGGGVKYGVQECSASAGGGGAGGVTRVFMQLAQGVSVPCTIGAGGSGGSANNGTPQGSNGEGSRGGAGGWYLMPGQGGGGGNGGGNGHNGDTQAYTNTSPNNGGNGGGNGTGYGGGGGGGASDNSASADTRRGRGGWGGDNGGNGGDSVSGGFLGGNGGNGGNGAVIIEYQGAV